MADETRVGSPGWRTVVDELNLPVADDATFLSRLLQVLAQVSAAKQAGLWIPEQAEEETQPRIARVWPAPAEGADLQGAVQGLDGCLEASREVFRTAQAGAVFLGRATGGGGAGDAYYGTDQSQPAVLAVPVFKPAGAKPNEKVLHAVVTLLIDARSKDTVRTTLAMAEVLAGYAHGHAARLQVREMRRASFAFDLATRLIGAVNNAAGFKGASIQLCNDLARQFDLDRVGLGWVHSDRVKLTALSDTEHFDRRMAMVQKLEAAMDEAFDQDQPVLFPQPPEEGPDGDVLLSQAVVHAHRELASGNASLRVASFPLRVEEEVVGVVLIESAAEGEIEVATVEMIQAAMDLLAPLLKLRRSDDRALPMRAAAEARKAGAWAVGPRHTVWKIASIFVLALLLFVTFFTIDYRVTADASVQPREKSIVSMPFPGLIERIGEGVEIDRQVKAGDLLVQLNTNELRLQVADARAKIAQAEKQAEAAIDEGDAASAGLAQMEAERARTELARIEYQIERSRIVAPRDGIVLEGDLTERVGSSMQLGDPLFVIAPLDELIVVAQVDERDIALVRAADSDTPALGALATKSRPNERIELEVDKILAVAVAQEGANVFEVRSKPLVLSDRQTRELRPGMEGLVRFRTEEHSLLWIGSRRLLDTVRLWLW